MSIFNELLPKINEISNTFTKNFNDDLKAIYECFDKFEEEYQNGRGRARDKAQKDKNPMTTLQSINEDEDEPNKNSVTVNSSDKSIAETVSRSSAESNNEIPRQVSKKRSKNEVDDLFSPEQDKRQKRNASVKAQSIISKQVNVNLTAKLRRDGSLEKVQSKGRKNKNEDNKENTEPTPPIQIKQEKISLPPEPMDMESLPVNIEVKQEPDKDEIAMPPPMAPVPKPRKGAAKEKSDEPSSGEDESSRSRRSTRTRKQTDTLPAPAPRSTRASSRASSRATKQPEEELPPPETRPKRTRAKKKVSEPAIPDCEKESTQISQESAPASPAEKPRPKRTRRAKATEKEPPKPETIPDPVPTKHERISIPETTHSPILQPKEKTKSNLTKEALESKINNKTIEIHNMDDSNTQINIQLDETRVINRVSQNGNTEMDKTVVLPNGVYNHAASEVRNMNETMVLEKQHVILDATVVIEKLSDPKATNMTDDNSIMTDDNDDPRTPPKQEPPKIQPTSAVKEKVQQFEELATRITRTKTRAMAKKEEEQTENQTPPDKISKPILSAETLTKMNNMIFNGKQPQISTSACKPRSNTITSCKSAIPASTSKLSGINKAREAAEESLKLEKEDARKKKEAMLEAKREQQKRKREEKMAAAAAAREAADRERKAAMEAAARERMEKQAHADLGKASRLREVERKKLELARKVAETEERRKAEEQARQQRLADEQRRADAQRRKQLEEAEAMKKEALIMAKEIEKRQKEYIEKQKMKYRLLEKDKMHTPLKAPAPAEPAYMADGFQYLNSDEDEEPPERPAPAWSTSKARKTFLCVQSLLSTQHIDRLFGVRAHTPDLRQIFPNIERARLKRTSSAVWRTPPSLRPVPE